MNLRNFRIFLLAAVTSATVLNAQSTNKSAPTVPAAQSTAKTAKTTTTSIEGFGIGVGFTNDLALRDAERDARSRLACNNVTSLRITSKQCMPTAIDSQGGDGQFTCRVQLSGSCSNPQTTQTAQTNPVKPAPAPRSMMSPASPTSSMAHTSSMSPTSAKSPNSATAAKP
jgi:hypothetical protein